MILLRVFFNFMVEVLEGFGAWFLQSFLYFWILVSSNALGRLLFIGVCGWVSDTWQSLIGDTCHSLIGLPMSSLTRARLLVSSFTRAILLVSSLTRAGLLISSLTRAGLLMSSLTRADVRLVFAWHLANFYWFLSSDRKNPVAIHGAL